MAGIIIPRDRTVKQSPRGYCCNPECLETSDQQRFEFDIENDHFCCPKCGADRAPFVGLLALVHLLVRHRQGPIVGTGGLRFKLACDDKRAYLATITNQEAATSVVDSANCPGCLKAWVDSGEAKASGFALHMKI